MSEPGFRSPGRLLNESEIIYYVGVRLDGCSRGARKAEAAAAAAADKDDKDHGDDQEQPVGRQTAALADSTTHKHSRRTIIAHRARLTSGRHEEAARRKEPSGAFERRASEGPE